MPASLEIEVLRKVIKGVEDYLQEAKKELEPDIKARLISLLYERFVKTGEESRLNSPSPNEMASRFHGVKI